MTNRRFGRTVCHTGNMVDNLKHRGNTATTSHWVALKDLIDDTAVEPGQRVLFSIQASGITIGLAQYRVGEFAAGSANGRSQQSPAVAHAPSGVGASGCHRAIPVGENGCASVRPLPAPARKMESVAMSSWRRAPWHVHGVPPRPQTGTSACCCTRACTARRSFPSPRWRRWWRVNSGSGAPAPTLARDRCWRST